MEISGLKEIIINGREVIIKLAEALSKLIPQFPANNIAGVIVLLISFWIASSIFNLFPNFKSNLLIKLLGTGALFYFLWLW